MYKVKDVEAGAIIMPSVIVAAVNSGIICLTETIPIFAAQTGHIATQMKKSAKAFPYRTLRF